MTTGPIMHMEVAIKLHDKLQGMCMCKHVIIS